MPDSTHPAAEPAPPTSFADLGLAPELLRAVAEEGYTTPTPIQCQAIPLVLAGQDIMGGAQTGTGKTAAFTLPILQRLLPLASSSPSPARHPVRALILAPTRELALQVHESVKTYSKYVPLRSMCAFGGVDIKPQIEELRKGIEILVATPGRLLDHVEQKSVSFAAVQALVLDEADRMLDMGFSDDIKTILKYVPEKRQTIMFSATMAPKIRKLAAAMLTEPESINIAISKPAAGIVQQAYVVYDNQKNNLLKEILKNEDYTSVIIFSSTKEKVKELYQTFSALNYSVKGFSSDLEQPEREEIMRNFKAKRLRILIGTDILSRGIDVEGISLVVNYDAPPDPEDYIHRIGRTARAERAGVAITFINEKDQQRFAQIEALMGMDVEKVPIPEQFGKGPVYDPEANKRKFDKPRGGKPGGGNKHGGKPRPKGNAENGAGGGDKSHSRNKRHFHKPKKAE